MSVGDTEVGISQHKDHELQAVLVRSLVKHPEAGFTVSFYPWQPQSMMSNVKCRFI